MAAYANPSIPLPPDLKDYYLNFGNPDAGFWNFLGGRGLGGQDLQSKYAQSQSSRYFNQYQGQAADNPGLGYFDFLNRGVNPQGDFENLSDLQKGYAPSNIMAPRARWVIR